MIELPDIRQTEGYDCGMAVRDAILKYRGLSGDGCVVASEYDGLSPDLMELSLRQAGVPVLAGTMSVKRLMYFTNREGTPVACPINVFGGHWVAVVGVDRKRVHYHCPLRGLMSMPRAEFDERWVDVTRRAHTYDHWGVTG